MEKVPFWQFNGEYLKVHGGQKPGATKDEVDGKGFSPWQYPNIHDKL